MKEFTWEICNSIKIREEDFIKKKKEEYLKEK